MRRKTWLAWLALLGLAPGWALAEETTAPGSGSSAASKGAMRSDDSASEWTSLSDLGGAKPATSASSAGMARIATSKAASKTANLNSSSGLTSLGAATASAAACGDCYGMGCSACSGACADPCGMGSLRRWSDPGMWGMWVDVDYLFWRLSGNDVPPLVTTAPPGVLPTLFNPGTSIAFGNDELDDEFRSGGRIRFGGWIEDTQSIGWQGHFFTLADERNSFNFAQPGEGAPSLGVPFLSIGPPAPTIESAVVIALDTPGPGFANSGSVNIATSSDVYSAGAVMRHFLYEDRGVRVDALAGYRFFRLDEGLVLSGSTTIGPNNPNPALPVGTVLAFQDLFDVENEFHGGELGLVMERDFGDLLSVELITKLALGGVEQRVRLEGANTAELAGFGTVATPGGLFVQPTNTGSPMARAQFERDEFAFLPEVNIKVGLQLTQQTRLTAGWTVIYMDNVVRSGDQIDRGVNPTQLGGGALVGPARPAFTFNDDDMWLYGASFGIESTY